MLTWFNSVPVGTKQVLCLQNTTKGTLGKPTLFLGWQSHETHKLGKEQQQNRMLSSSLSSEGWLMCASSQTEHQSTLACPTHMAWCWHSRNTGLTLLKPLLSSQVQQKMVRSANCWCAWIIVPTRFSPHCGRTWPGLVQYAYSRVNAV